RKVGNLCVEVRHRAVEVFARDVVIEIGMPLLHVRRHELQIVAPLVRGQRRRRAVRRLLHRSFHGEKRQQGSRPGCRNPDTQFYSPASQRARGSSRRYKCRATFDERDELGALSFPNCEQGRAPKAIPAPSFCSYPQWQEWVESRSRVWGLANEKI